MSIKDIGILTTLSALLLLQQDIITSAILLVSSAALLFLLIIFVLSAIKKISRLGSGESLLPLAPALLIPVIWMFPSVSVFLISPVSFPSTTPVAYSSLGGLAVAAIPVMLNLDSRRSHFDDKTLWIVAWALVVGMATASATTSLMVWLEIEWPGMTMLQQTRVAMLFSMLASVLVTWMLLGPRKQIVFPVDDI